MTSDLERLSPLGSELTRRARAAGVMMIWRAQTRALRHVVVRQGRAESSTVTSVSGHGLQLVSEGGHTALGNRDDFEEDPGLALFDRVLEWARAGERLGVRRVAPTDLSPTVERHVPDGLDAFGKIDLQRVARRLAEIEARIGGLVPGVTLTVSFRAEVDAWRIMRDDGTDVLFAIPRCTLGARATGTASADRHPVSASFFSTDPDILWNETGLSTFMKRAEGSARLATALPDAPPHAAGSFPLVIDYGLAKGLAHEAFGHAAEADGYRSSILAKDGRLRRGELVGADHLSIIDEPVEGDHAWQPYSANGLRRERALIVDHGRLEDGLSDPWSAEPGGVRLTASARSESYRHAPQPRMTNIRIEADDPLPAPGEFEDYGPEEVRELLSAAGVFRRHPRITFLSGYRGGQVNTATGDFMFQCKSIYDLDAKGAKLHKPAIFSGSMFGALRSVREAFGPLQLDAIGYCGKWGQSVPSSGGSHYFLVLDPDDSVRLGGR